jgi:hypothetical protein
VSAPARGRILLGCVAFLALMRLLSLSSTFVEAVYAERFGTWASRALVSVSGLVPISLAEWILVGAVLWALGAIAALTIRVWRREQRAAALLSHSLLRVAAVAAVALVLFYALWGIHYARADLAERVGWPRLGPVSRAQTAELARLAEELLLATNREYELATGRADLGRPTERPESWSDVEASIDEGYRRVASLLELPAAFAASRGRAKPLALSEIVSHLGLSGFYFPWTGEANYNRLVPSCSLPHVIAHEKAHQRGIAQEDEAEFLGFLACASSERPYVRYSGRLFAQRTLLFELRRSDPAAAQGLVSRRHPGVQRDVDALVAFWRRYEGRPAAVSQAVNDRYLKAHGVEEGVLSYDRSARLLVLYARSRGGSLE